MSIFDGDPLMRFEHEKAHGLQWGSADHEALKELMLAVLEDGIACYQKYFVKPSRRNEKLFQEAKEWINSNDDGVHSFNNICETLELCPETVRRGLERWRAKQMGIARKERPGLLLGKGKFAVKRGKAA